MFHEHAILNIKEGQSAAFETAIAEAAPLIAASPGFAGMEVRPCVEHPGRYLFLVRWETVADHERGFRLSDRYQKWRAMLHQFYEPFPIVEHYGEPVVTA